MRPTIRSVAVVFGLLFFGVAAAGPYEEMEACRIRYDLGCTAYVAAESTVFRKHPSRSAEVVIALPRGSELRLAAPEPSRARDGRNWYRVVLAPSGELPFVVAYAQESEVVAARDLFRVRGCWPVAALAYEWVDEGGPFRQRVRFRVDGGAALETQTGLRPRLFVARNGMFLIVEEVVSEDQGAVPMGLAVSSPILAFEDSRWRAYSLRQPAEDGGPGVEMASRTVLAGCRSVPDLDPTRSLLTESESDVARRSVEHRR